MSLKMWSLAHTCAALCLLGWAVPAVAQTVAVDTSASGRHQAIDGFGTCCGALGLQSWYSQLYFDDVGFSILRTDITPTFSGTYANLHYCSPWFGQAAPLTLDNSGNGPDGTRTRHYTGPADYSSAFGGCSVPIAVMGPDIDVNVGAYDYTGANTANAGALAQLGTSKRAALGGFKFYASVWSPAPWLKVASGDTYGAQSSSPYPAAGTAFPFIWGGNFAGGKLDTSGTPVAQFNDSALGGTGPTSALTQFARGLAAYLRGYQNAFNVKFDAISIQNELGFEEFYNSTTYHLSAEYIAALKAARAELNKYPDLATIQIAGPEDVMGDSSYQLWELGAGAGVSHKSLQLIANVEADPVASQALAFFNIHGYAGDGISSAGANPTAWQWWATGWKTSPAPGMPASVQGFTHFNKKSWMTETSGEDTGWLSPAGSFPSNGAWSIALKIHQALTVGQQSAWLYWQFADGSPVGNYSLTDQTSGATAPKLVAMKHFARHVRPGAVRVDATVSGSTTLAASAFVHDADGTLTVVLINEANTAATTTVRVPTSPAGLSTFEVRTSSNGSFWKPSTASASGGTVSVMVPGYGVVTLVGTGAGSAADGGATVADAGADGGRSSPDGGHSGSDGGYGDSVDAGPGADGNPAVGACGCGHADAVGSAAGWVLIGLLARARRPKVMAGAEGGRAWPHPRA